MEVREDSKNIWSIEITDEDKRKIKCIVQQLKPLTKPLREYGKWKEMSAEQLWEKIIEQFCVIQGIGQWNQLKRRKKDYKEFMEKMRLANLTNKENRVEYLRQLFLEYRPHRWTKKMPTIIDRFLSNEKTVKKGDLVIFDALKNKDDENDMRDILVKNCYGFGMKSISDLMIEIGMTRNLIAFDTRIVGLLTEFFGLSIWTLKSGKLESDKRIIGKIGDNKALYEAMEEKLREVCREIEDDLSLSLLDRVFFNATKSVIEYILEIECG